MSKILAFRSSCPLVPSPSPRPHQPPSARQAIEAQRMGMPPYCPYMIGSQQQEEQACHHCWVLTVLPLLCDQIGQYRVVVCDIVVTSNALSTSVMSLRGHHFAIPLHAGLKLAEGQDITLKSLFDIGFYPGKSASPVQRAWFHTSWHRKHVV